MTTRGNTAADGSRRRAESMSPDTDARPARSLFRVVLLSAWCGLVAGLLEVTTIVLRKRLYDTNHLYGMSRHFIWLIPVTNVGVFVVFGLLGCVVFLTPWRQGRWLFWRLLCALSLLPTILVAVPQIFSLAWLVVALGVAVRLVPLFERHPVLFRRVVQVSFPFALAAVTLLWASLWVADRSRQSRSAAAPLPAPASPNVLLIVMDTVAAGHLSLHGYNRATSTTLVELADRGIKFDSAQAAAPWTLPSHATMFTGRWMHELGVGWLTCRSTPALPIPPWGNFSGRRAMRRPASWPTPAIVPAIRDWAAGLPNITTLSFPVSRPSRRRPSSVALSRASSRQ